MDLKELAKKEFEDIEREENELKKEFKQKMVEIKKRKLATKKYLEARGVLEVKKRSRRKKEEPEK